MKNIPTHNSNGFGRHQNTTMRTDAYLTPPRIVQALGPFDLDPCSPIIRPWPTATHHFTIEDNGYLQQWWGRVWLNPPYGKMMYHWVNKLALHGNGIALIFARTDTKGFQENIFPFVDSMLFIRRRLRFHNEDGTLPERKWAPAPSVLCAFGEYNVERLGDSGIEGKHILVNMAPVIVIGSSPTWKSVITIVMGRINSEASLQTIYQEVERLAPDKVAANKHFREKVRQVLQTYFNRIKRGRYAKAA